MASFSFGYLNRGNKKTIIRNGNYTYDTNSIGLLYETLKKYRENIGLEQGVLMVSKLEICPIQTLMGQQLLL